MAISEQLMMDGKYSIMLLHYFDVHYFACRLCHSRDVVEQTLTKRVKKYRTWTDKVVIADHLADSVDRERQHMRLALCLPILRVRGGSPPSAGCSGRPRQIAGSSRVQPGKIIGSHCTILYAAKQCNGEPTLISLRQWVQRRDVGQ